MKYWKQVEKCEVWDNLLSSTTNRLEVYNGIVIKYTSDGTYRLCKKKNHKLAMDYARKYMAKHKYG